MLIANVMNLKKNKNKRDSFRSSESELEFPHLKSTYRIKIIEDESLREDRSEMRIPV